MKNLFVDLEIIAANNGLTFEKIIEKIEYKASEKYLNYISSLYANGMISEEEYRVLLEESYDYKDRVLEEVDTKYQNQINFKEIYEINASNQSMVDYIEKISSSIETYIIFYYNTEREYLEKMDVCKRYFPKCKALGIKFYMEKYNQDYKRKRTNKAKYIRKQLQLKDLDDCMLIDKSVRSCDEWNALKGDATLYCKHISEDDFSSDDTNVLKISK